MENGVILPQLCLFLLFSKIFRLWLAFSAALDCLVVALRRPGFRRWAELELSKHFHCARGTQEEIRSSSFASAIVVNLLQLQAFRFCSELF